MRGSLLVVAALSLSATVVDRTAIAVGDRVITESEITKRIRLTAFQNGQLSDLSLTSRREAAQRLIDIRLVEHEMEIGHYAPIAPEAAEKLLQAFTAEHFRSSAEALGLALKIIDLTPVDLRDELAEQADLLSFTSLRFRPAVEVSDKEIEEYYRNHIQSASPAPPSLADARANIEQILANERADLDLDAWLRDQRKRTRILYLEKELEPPAQ